MTAKKKPSSKSKKPAKKTIKLQYGVNLIEVDGAYEGKSVDAILSLFQTALNLPDMAIVYVNGDTVEGNYAVKAGDSLEFIKPAGRKG